MASAWNEAWTQNLSQQADPSTASPGEEHRALGGEREVKEGASEAGAPKVRCTQENIKPGGPRQSQKPRCGPCQGSTWRAAGGGWRHRRPSRAWAAPREGSDQGRRVGRQESSGQFGAGTGQLVRAMVTAAALWRWPCITTGGWRATFFCMEFSQKIHKHDDASYEKCSFSSRVLLTSFLGNSSVLGSHTGKAPPLWRVVPKRFNSNESFF